jgi:hypothetical protein
MPIITRISTSYVCYERMTMMISLPTRSCPTSLRKNTVEEAGTQESWTFKCVTDHQGLMTSKHKDYKGPSFNVLVKWEDGSESYEPLDIIRKDDPITVAQYAEDYGLLDTPGWKKLKRFVKNKRMLTGWLSKQSLHLRDIGFSI